MKYIMPSSNFIQDCVNGNASISDLDDYIKYWYTVECKCSLLDFLGLTEEEYSKWINAIIEMRKRST